VIVVVLICFVENGEPENRKSFKITGWLRYKAYSAPLVFLSVADVASYMAREPCLVEQGS
jgi:hypothetical protein